MGDLWGNIITGLSSFAVTSVGSWFLFRGKKVDQTVEKAKTDATAAASFLDGQVAFQEYVDKQVDEKVAQATSELRAQLASFAERLERVQNESHEMNDAVRHQQTQAWLWDLHGRRGEMPMLPRPVLEKLGIGHLVTATAD